MPEAGGEVRPRFEVSGRGLVAAGRPRPVPGYSDLLSRCSGAAGGRCGRALGPGLLAESAQIPVVEAVAGDKEAHPGASRGQAGRAPTRAARSRPGLLPRGPRLGKSPLAAPAHPSGHCTQQRVSPSPLPPKVWADCKSCCSVIVGQTGPFSWERGAGMWRIPGKDYINQSIISLEKPSTNQSKS